MMLLPILGRLQVGLPSLSRRALAVLAFVSGAAAQEPANFVMLERHDCPWCRRWHREVGAASWNGSDLGQRAPLRRVDLAAGLPDDLRALASWRFTPTFVLLSGGQVVGRIIGYQGDLFFWQQAEALLALLPYEPTEKEPSR